MLPREGYTEALATVLHTLFLALQLKLPFRVLFRAELLWSLLQVKKVLAFFGLSPAAFRAKHSGVTILTADVFSYFFLKTAFLWNLVLFLEGQIEEALTASVEDPAFWGILDALPLPTDPYLKSTLRFSAFQLDRNQWGRKGIKNLSS